MTRRQPQRGAGRRAGEVVLLRELRCVRCGCRSTNGDGFMLADATLATIDDAFTSATMDNTQGTIAAVCSICAPHVTELLRGIS